MSLFRRRRSGSTAPTVQGVAPRRAHAGLLRRERRALLRVREDKLRDLGGLMVEMYSRSAFRNDLLQERCAELVGIDTRLTELDELLHGRAVTRRCQCGAPILRGSHFCPNCGRQVHVVAGGGALEDTVIERPGRGER
jgi:hypothetical protein